MLPVDVVMGANEKEDRTMLASTSDLTRSTPLFHEHHGEVVAVGSSPVHAFNKSARSTIHLTAGRGVDGDSHAGETVQHRSRVARDPSQPNLRQVHLIHAELLDELRAAGFDLVPGELGENVTTRGIDLLALPTGTRLSLGATAVVRLTGLRNPCNQLDHHAPGLTAAVLDRDAEGRLVRKAGVMAVVLASGWVTAHDAVRVQFPEGEPMPLAPV